MLVALWSGRDAPSPTLFRDGMVLMSAKCTGVIDGRPVPSARKGGALVLTLALSTGAHDLQVAC